MGAIAYEDLVTLRGFSIIIVILKPKRVDIINMHCNNNYYLKNKLIRGVLKTIANILLIIDLTAESLYNVMYCNLSKNLKR